MNDLAARAREIALRLTSWPSVTGSADEARFAHKLAAYLTGFDLVWTSPLENDSNGRANLFALKRGRGAATVVLTGHFDTVPIEDYGNLQHLAWAPERLLPELIERLRATGENSLALADLESGDYLPGRGLLDMKAGLAGGLAAIEAYDGEANLLFVAVCDEEDRSAGARAAATQIASIAEEHGLDIALVINLDAISDQGDGSAGRVIALGSIGKQLLTAFVVGRDTHACFPRDGVNAAYLAAELVTEFELAPELAEISGSETAAPPTVLAAKDLKSGYNVTTPASAWVYWNTLQHRRSAEDVLDIGLGLARRAMARAAGRMGCAIPVMSYAELAAFVPDTDKAIASLQHLDLPERSKLLTRFAWDQSGRTGPAVVMGFGSIPYPAVTLQDPVIEKTVRACASKLGVGVVSYFPGISDMSFFGRATSFFCWPAIQAGRPFTGVRFRETNGPFSGRQEVRAADSSCKLRSPATVRNDTQTSVLKEARMNELNGESAAPP